MMVTESLRLWMEYLNSIVFAGRVCSNN